MKALPWKKCLYILFLCCTAVILTMVSRASGQDEDKKDQAVTTAAATYVGAEECAACHDPLTATWHKNIHSTKAFADRSDKQCETCHGPGSAHVESGGDPALIQSFKRMRPDDAAEVCLQCHLKGSQTMWHGSVHESRDLSCNTCHSIHNPVSDKFQLTAKRVEQVCETCHLPIKAQIQKTSHHPIREGLMTCTNCHNPHGTPTPKMITANSVNQQCYECHTEKKGPFLWEHPPVKENCLNCHNPHGSNHPKLMVAKRPFLCQSCHLEPRHPGTLYDGSPGQLASNRDFSRSCSNCHLAIHGSNHPSGWTFTR